MPNAIQLHESLPNFYMEQPVFKGEDTAELFEDAPVVAEGSFHSQHEPHLPIEPDVVPGLLGHRRHDDHPVQVPESLGERGRHRPGLRHPQGEHPHAAELRRAVLSATPSPPAPSRWSSPPSRTWTCPARLTPQLRRVQPHHGQAVRHLHERPDRLRRRGQDHRRRIRRGPRPWRLRGRPHLQQPDLRRLPRLQHPQLQGAGPGRLLEPRVQHGLPRLRRSADLHHHRGAHRHGGREGRHRSLGVPLQERGPAGRPDHQQPAVPRLHLSEAARDGQAGVRPVQGRGRGGQGRGPARGRGDEPGRLHRHHRHVRLGRGGAGAQPRRHHHPLQHLGRHGPGRRHRHPHPHREGARAAGHQAGPGQAGHERQQDSAPTPTWPPPAARTTWPATPPSTRPSS